MKRYALVALCTLAHAQFAEAAGVVQVADGDCAALQAAAGAAPGQQPSLIRLARNGHYICDLRTTGAVVIDGASSAIIIGGNNSAEWTTSGVVTIRNAQLALSPIMVISEGTRFVAPWTNLGDLILDSTSILVSGGPGPPDWATGVIGNSGFLTLQNVTVTSATDLVMPVVDNYGGHVDVTNSTLAVRDTAFASGTVTVGNSILTHTSAVPLCTESDVFPLVATSLGGNVLSDDSCGFNSASDRITNDASFTDLGTHGGVVNTLELSYYSPARDAGLAANCAATDARGVARGTAHCSAGAYEYGGGAGQLSASGASGLYFDPAHNGHYVTIQRLDWGDALVIWNTFDETGAPAWLYGVGTVNGKTIHVPQVSQNLGGKLQPGGAVIGSQETIWGSFDFTVSDCLSASLTYHSMQPKYGSGTVSFTRLALVQGLDCSE